jgi:hypothetical protein
VQQDVLALRRRFWTRFKAGHSSIPTYLLSIGVKTKKLLKETRIWPRSVLGSIGLCWNFLHRSNL